MSQPQPRARVPTTETNPNLEDATKTTHSVVSEEKIRQLCEEDPLRHEGYEVVYDSPTKPLTAREVYEVIVKLRVRQSTLRQNDPSLTDDEISEILINESEDFKLFATNSHPTIYKKLKDRNTPQHVLDTIMQMIRTKIAIENNQVDEDMALAALQREVLNKCLKKK
jgi:hypothetical protein